MKQGHLALLFLICFLGCFLFLQVEQERYDMVQKEKNKIEQALMEAIEITGKEYSSVIYASGEKKKQLIENVFFESIFMFMGMDEQEEQDKLRFYVPMLALVEEEGALFLYMQEEKINGVTQIEHVWSELLPFEFPEGSSNEKKKEIMIRLLEERASEIISNHNYIATQYGISYTFSVPVFLQDISGDIEVPILIAVFQGWPLTAAGDVLCENCVDSGVYLQEKEHYIVQLPNNLNNTTSLYHKKSCSELNTEVDVVLTELTTERDAIYKYGAFPCEFCKP